MYADVVCEDVALKIVIVIRSFCRKQYFTYPKGINVGEC